MERNAYKSTKPLGATDVLEALKKLQREKARLEAECDSLQESLKEVKGEIAKHEAGIDEALRALNESRGVYELKNGEITTASPDAQTTFADA